MGSGNSTQTEVMDDSLTKEEFSKLQAIFKSGFQGKVGELLQQEQLKYLWSGKIPEDLLTRILKYFYQENSSPSKKKGVDFHKFAKLFVQAVRGSADEKAALIIKIASSKNESSANTLLLKEYVQEIIVAYIEAEKSTKQFESWTRNGCTIVANTVDKFASSLVHDLIFSGKIPKETFKEEENHRDCTVAEISSWLMACPDLNNMQAAVFEKLYFGSDTPAGDDAVCLFPFCRDIPRGAFLHDGSFPSMLDMASIAFLNSAMPNINRNYWRFLFSSRMHGESFSKMLGSILKQGSTLIIIKDKGGRVFGGFATSSWNLSPQFYGNENCFLFHLNPKMNIYRSTGYNNHYQYLNVQQQTMPNGLGMGGVMEYFGLFLDSSYGPGFAGETCTTYHSPMLSSDKNFEIAELEVWGVGPRPKTPAEMGERPSILDYDNEAKAILAMAGKGGFSDGCREPEDIYEPE